MMKLSKYLSKKDLAGIAAALVFIVAAVYCDLSLPGYMSQITVLIQTQGSAIADVWSAAGMMLLCAFGSLVASIGVGFFASKVSASLAHSLRQAVYHKTLSFSMEEMNRFSTASLITRSTNDITQIQNVVAMGMQFILKAPITAVWAVTKIMGKSWQWTAVTAGAVAILLVVIVFIIVFALPRFKRVQRLTDKLNAVTRENLTGLRVIRAYNAEDYQEAKFEESNKELTDTNMTVNRAMAVMQPSMSFIMSALSLAIYVIGAVLIQGAGATQGLVYFSDMVVFSSYAVQILMSFMMLVVVFILLPRASVSASRINEVLDSEVRIIDGTEREGKPGMQGSIDFINVSFRYPEASGYALENISFSAKPGETVAIIGATGSGKSTLINLIPRFYDVTQGEVLVDGVNVKHYEQQALREKLGYVSQQATLFRGSIRSNVSYGDNGKPAASEEQMAKAIDIAQGSAFVQAIPEGYDAPVAQGGKNFSGGQKQRLSIARAINRVAEILIFDDSFSALDYKTDSKLRGALKKNLAQTTKLIVAQRIGTIKDADKIIVLDEGRMVGIGKHQELLQSCAVYQEIANSQLSKEELKHA